MGYLKWLVVAVWGLSSLCMFLQLSAPLEIGVRQEVSVVSDIEMDEQKAFQVCAVHSTYSYQPLTNFGSSLSLPDQRQYVRQRVITFEDSAPL